MKRAFYIFSIFLFLATAFQGCEDLEEVDVPNFEVTFDKTAKIGEPVEFNVRNAPNFLYFYAGDFQHQYKHRERINAEGTVTMSFLNSQKWGLGDNAEGTLTVWYSKDYDGSGTADAVKNATWTEITDRFNISTLYDFILQESGEVDITDLADGKPIYFAFRYLTKIVDSRGAEWYLDDLKITMDVEDAPAPLTVASESSPGFKPVDVQGISEVWNEGKWFWDSAKGENGLWRLRGQKPDNTLNEDWLITGAINLTKVAPDKGLSLKTYSEKLDVFTYTYTKTGTYTLTLIGSNETIYGKKEKIQEYSIEVTE